MVIPPPLSAVPEHARASLRGFVPSALAARLQSRELTAAEARFEGAVLFADIVGFTELTERLSGLGESGLETLSGLLNHWFASYVAEVRACGGEVVIFAGDALLAYWPAGADASLEAVTGHAALAASRLLSIQGRPGDGERPELHMGLAAGALWAARVGSAQQGFQLVLGGPAVRHAVRAEALAERGEIVASKSAAELLNPSLVAGFRERHSLLDVSTLGARTPRRDPPEEPELRASWPFFMVPRVIRERFPSQEGGSLSELRHVTPVFLRIDGVDDTRPDALELLQRVYGEIHEIRQRFSAESGRLLIDDKGFVFLLVFGIPQNTHADDLERALCMVLAIENKLSELGLGCAAGIATGRCFCGVLGSPERCEYSTVGPAMNLAARLMAAAGSGLLTPRPDRPLGDPELVLEAEGDLTLKGLKGGPELVRVSTRAPSSGRDGVLQGRGGEQARLERILNELRLGEGGLVSLLGEAGMGKSTLALDLMERARRLGLVALSGQADPRTKTSFGAFRAVLCALLDLGADVSSGSLERAARVRLARLGRAGFLPLLGPVLGLSLGDTPQSAALSGAARAEATLGLLSDLLQDAASEPLLVLLEDVHFMDSASFRLVERLLRRAENILFVLTSRSAEIPGLKEAAGSARRYEAITLAPLDVAASTALAEKLWGGEALPSGLQSLVEKESGGNPLHIVESVLLASDALRQPPEAGATARDSMPDRSVHALITARIDRLSPRQVLAIKAASVLGGTIDWQLMERLLNVAPQDADEPDLAWTLVRQRLLAPVAGRNGAFRFAHDLIRDVAYELMPVQQRRHWHRQAASALEEIEGGAASKAALALHWFSAGDLDKTLVWSELAGVEALETGAFEEAARHFERCLTMSDEARDRPAPELMLRWYRKSCDAYAGMGDSARRSENARAALSHAGQKLAAIGATSNAGAATELLLSRFSPSSKKPEAERLEIAALYRHVAHVAYFESDGPGLFVSTLRAVQAAEGCAPSPALCGALAELGGALGLGGLTRPALAYLERAVETAERIGLPHGLAYVYMVRGLFLVGRGQWPEALESAERCQRHSEAAGDSVDWGNAQIVRFWIAYYRGDIRRAEAEAAALLIHAQRVDNHQQEAWALRAAALVKLYEDDCASALRELELAQRGQALQDTNETMPTLAAMALAHLRLGDRARATELAISALELAEKLGRPTGHAILAGLSAVAEIAVAHADAWRAEERIVRRALSRLDEYRRVFPIGQPAYARFKGWAAKRAGRKREARRWLDRAVREAERLGMGLEREALGQLGER